MTNAYDKIQRDLKNKPETWLVTGAAGFIGSHIVEKLLHLDQRVIGIDNFLSNKDSNLPLVQSNLSADRWENFDFFDADVSNLELCQEIFSLYPDIKYVIHEAALCSVPQSIAHADMCHKHNATGFLNLMISSLENKVSRVVYASSSAVYGDSVELPCIENRTGRLLSPYALTKYVDELYAQLYTRQYGLSTVGLRYFNVFGPRQDPQGAYAAVIPQWISALLQQESVTLYGDGSQTRDFCYVDNVVQANLLSAVNPLSSESPIVYNVGSGSSTKIIDLLDHIQSLFQNEYPEHSVDVIRLKNRGGEVKDSRADISLIEKHLGYQPSLDFQTQLENTYQWYLTNLLPNLSSPKTTVIKIGEHIQSCDTLKPVTKNNRNDVSYPKTNSRTNHL
ncbi:MAG: NAD-dependent epimerase/dehydratase family protein [Verrucomicrobiota bacterium]